MYNHELFVSNYEAPLNLFYKHTISTLLQGYSDLLTIILVYNLYILVGNLDGLGR